MTALTRGKFTAILAAMFFIGAGAGSLGMIYKFRQAPPRPPGPPPGGNNWSRTNSMVDWLADNLKLTPEQRTKLQPAFDKFARDSAFIRTNMMAQMNASVQEINREILPLLNDEQRQKFEEMDKNRKLFLDAMGRGRGGGRGPRGDNKDENGKNRLERPEDKPSGK
jgi:hypothetical protein